ncbi:MAG TPA: leucyl aminopeptidase [Acidimicrobiales bacterium]|jgi:leucyl aminopeptidase|nr:leucyl aminopeptidase [Acidimicrobiales bacterium]
MPITFSTSRDVPDDAPVLAIPVFADGTVPAGSPAELDNDFLAARDFQGKVGQTLPLLADDGTTILAVGVGAAGEVDDDVLRRAAHAAVRNAGKANVVAMTLLDAAPGDADRGRAAQAIAEGASLGTYKFTTYKSDAKRSSVERVVLVTRAGNHVQRGLDRGSAIASAVALARDLINEPPGAMTPRRMEEVARAVAAEGGLTVDVWDEERIAADGLGGLAGVAAGSDEPARLIQLTYDPPGARGTLALVGKGITFDSGGLSIKTGEGMMTMKCDMSGAAAVIAAMAAIPAVAPKVRVLAFAACTENLPSGKAMKPGDVLKIRNGKTVEVLNTDAEGRLVLADALSLAVEQSPDGIVDLATLTGAMSVALGRDIAGLFSNDDDLADQVGAAAERAGEPMWRMPLAKRYRKQIDSEVADIKNIGAAGQAGSITAALFLEEFVGDVPWVHLDIAGPAFRADEDGYLPKGGTGYGVRTLVDLVANYRKPSRRR